MDNKFIQLTQMMEDMQQQSPLYRPTTFWIEASKIIIEEMREKGIESFRSHNSATSMFVPLYAFPDYTKNPSAFKDVIAKLHETTKDVKSRLKFDLLLQGHTQAFADYRVLAASNKDVSPYTDKVSESSAGKPLEQFTFDGRNFSRSFLNYLLGLSFLKKHVDTSSIKNVLEIGGGFGTLGEILLGDERNKCFYMNVDIPPVVQASTYYLKNCFGEENIGDYTRLKSYAQQNNDILDIESLKKKYKALNFCSWQLPKLKGKIDLFVNFISFQEMEPEVVQNYCKHITRLSPQFILLRNIQEGKKVQDETHIYGVKEAILGNNYDEFLPEYKLLKTDESIFGLKMEDNFHSQLRLYVKK